MKFFLLPIFLTSSFSLNAVTIRLFNETHYPLSATIRGSDGTLLGDVSVQPQEIVSWSDDSISRSHLPLRPPSKSVSPFSVHWVCPDGESFCVSSNVTSGALVKTSQCVGRKVCKEEQPKKEE